MGNLKGDFLGFTFDGIHSSELGIIRTSDGSRYTDNLLPTIQDKTVQVPGADGTYYFGSYYTNKTINFPIAFDELTEEQFRKIKVLFGDKKVHSLIFDELPFKVYKVKTTGTPNLKYLCFDKPKETDWRDEELDAPLTSKKDLYGIGVKNTTGRLYKGEGQLSFTAYSPFAKSRFKYLDEYIVQNIPEWGSMDENNANDVHYNYYDWAEASRMVLSTEQKKYGKEFYQIDVPGAVGVMYHNAGDLPVHYTLTFMAPANVPDYQLTGLTYLIKDTLNENNYLTIENLALADGDRGFRINGNLNLVEGLDKNGNPTGVIYNKYITQGDFFKLETTEDLTFLQIENVNAKNMQLSIDYKYLYY